MPKLKGCAGSAEYHNNSAEAQGTEERLKILKSVVSMHCAMDIMPPNMNYTASVPVECLNLSAKALEMRKHLMPILKASDSEVNISGINLNHSVTDQITQRSRNKDSSDCGISVTEARNVKEFREADSKRVNSLDGCGDAFLIPNSSFIQQRNAGIVNSPGHQNESSSAVSNFKNLNMSNELPSKSSDSETKVPSEQSAQNLISRLTMAAALDSGKRQNVDLNTNLYSLPLLNQAAATTATHQLSRGTPALLNQTFPLNQLLLQNQLALQIEQQRVLEKHLQLQTSAASIGTILAAFPQFLPNAVLSPEVLFLHYQEWLRDALFRQQQQQLNPVSVSENNDVKVVPESSSKAVVAESSKKDVAAVSSLPQTMRGTDRTKELLKESILEKPKDMSPALQKRSELILHGTVNDAVDQHFTESLRLAGQKPSPVVLPSGRDHRLVTQQDHLSSVVHHLDQHTARTISQNNLGHCQSENLPMKETQKLKLDVTATLGQVQVSAHPSSLYLPSSQASTCKMSTGTAAGLLPSSSVLSSTSTAPCSNGNQMRKEPNFNLYGYQPCAIYVSQNAVDERGLKDEKKAVRIEPDCRNKSLEKFPLTGDAVRLTSAQLAVVDDGRPATAAEARNVFLTSLAHYNHSSKLQKNEKLDVTNATGTKNTVLLEQNVCISSTSDEMCTEGTSLNYVMAATASKGQPVFIPVLPILATGQSVKMPTLKDCLASKPLSTGSKIVIGPEGVGGGSVVHNGHSFGVQPSVIGVPDRTLNGLLSSLPISSAAAVYSFSLSHSQGLQLFQSSSSLAVASSSSSVTSSMLNLCPQTGTKRDYKMANDSNGFANETFTNDFHKRIKTNLSDAQPMTLSPAVIATATADVLCPVPSTSFSTTTSSPNSSKMHLTYSDCFRSFVETTNSAVKTASTEDQLIQTGSLTTNCDRGAVIINHKVSEEASSAEEIGSVLDLKLTSVDRFHHDASLCRIHDNLNEVNDSETTQGTDSDTLSANSPAMPLLGLSLMVPAPTARSVSSESGVQKQWQHTKFKKAWLQRYSDEDKKLTGTAQDADNENKMERENELAISCPKFENERECASAGVTNNDTTSTASEQDSSGWISATDSTSSNTVRKKRKSNRHLAKSEPPDKMHKLSSDTDESRSSSSALSSVIQKKMKVKQHQNKEKDEEEDRGCCQSTLVTEESTEANGYSLIASSAPEMPDCQLKILQCQTELKHSSCRDDPSVILANKALNTSSDEHHQLTMEIFLQDGACRDITPRLVKCRECKLARNKKDKRVPNDFCRFYAFRRLRYSPKRFLTIAGFSEPGDADALDIELWMPVTPVIAPPLDIDTARYIIMYAGGRFSSLIEQEREAMSWVPPDCKIAWKRAVQGVREMCDICDATLFNMHWVCEKCGFAVCIDCFWIRTHTGEGHCQNAKCLPCENHGRKWLTCSANRQLHEPNHLMLAQIIPSDVLWLAGKMLEQIGKKFQFQSKTKLEEVSTLREAQLGELHKATLAEPFSGIKCEKTCQSSLAFSDLSLLAEAAAAAQDARLMAPVNGLENEVLGSADTKCSTLKDLLTKATSSCPSTVSNVVHRPSASSTQSSLEEIIHKVIKLTSAVSKPKAVSLLSHYIPCNRTLRNGQPKLFPKCMPEQPSNLFLNVPHSWLDDGRVLQLHDSGSSGNLRLFQQQWQHGLPVVISNCDGLFDHSLWKPETFSKEFGHFEIQLINCIDGEEICGQRMKKFWDGFERISCRPKDKDNYPMVLKLKDWPPKDDFCEIMPNHFQDFMQNLPLPEYTKSIGMFNLVSRLPEFFAKPDLGPKLHCAYGLAKDCNTGTTSLHLQVSDSFNLLVYIGVPKDDLHIQNTIAAAVESCGCCQLMKKRLQEPEAKPGAVWHIFDPDDADKIRDLLNKIAFEEGKKVDPHHDPIYDESWYLDRGLRERLLNDYGVQCCTIVQCLGDAVFIPAGAPHQVSNLNSCIKVSSEFVSPENLDNCFKVTQECHHLSGETQGASHEDKLQVKNIIYHAIKDAIAVLNEALPNDEG